MSTLQRLYEINERMSIHRLDMREPLVINTSEVEEVAEYIFSIVGPKSPNANLEFLKNAVRAKKAKLWGRTILVLS